MPFQAERVMAHALIMEVLLEELVEAAPPVPELPGSWMAGERGEAVGMSCGAMSKG